MTDNKLDDLVRTTLVSVAPDLEGEKLDPDVPIRDQVEFDSMDFLNFVIALSKAGNIEIPEEDYPELMSLHGAATYIEAHRKAA